MPKFQDIGYSEEDFAYVKRGMLPPRKMHENVYPMANSILHEFKYMEILKKRRSKKRTQSMKHYNNKYDSKIYLDNYPKDTVLTKNVSALLLAQKVKWIN